MITALEANDFTLFSQVLFRFGAVNVIHGANSSGKSHLLKLLYTVTSALAPRPNDPRPERPTKGWLDKTLGRKLSSVFRPANHKIGRLASRVQGTRRASITVNIADIGSVGFSFSTRSDRAVSTDEAPTGWLEQAPIYIPTRELLSVYPGFASLYETQAVPFDETWRDTCLLLGAPVARGPKKKEIADLLKPLEQAIGCKTSLDGDRFFLQQMHSPKARIEADLVAEGYRKLSMVARLIANGSLDDKGYLFWDEPEANLNALLVKRIAPLILDLAAGGVQVFVTTHSLFLMRELEIARATRGAASPATHYIGLHPCADGVSVSQGSSIEESGDIAALDETLEQSDRYMSAMQT